MPVVPFVRERMRWITVCACIFDPFYLPFLLQLFILLFTRQSTGFGRLDASLTTEHWFGAVSPSLQLNHAPSPSFYITGQPLTAQEFGSSPYTRSYPCTSALSAARLSVGVRSALSYTLELLWQTCVVQWPNQPLQTCARCKRAERTAVTSMKQFQCCRSNLLDSPKQHWRRTRRGPATLQPSGKMIARVGVLGPPKPNLQWIKQSSSRLLESPFFSPSEMQTAWEIFLRSSTGSSPRLTFSRACSSIRVTTQHWSTVRWRRLLKRKMRCHRPNSPSS